MLNNNSILRQLDDFSVFIKHEAKTGGDLYDGFKNYRQFVLDNWPEGMVDLQNWIQLMDKVLARLEMKKEVSNISKSNDLSSFKNDADEIVSHFNGEFKFHFSQQT